MSSSSFSLPARLSKSKKATDTLRECAKVTVACGAVELPVNPDIERLDVEEKRTKFSLSSQAIFFFSFTSKKKKKKKNSK